jgi:uncharacterized paraquat-inducible protein A
MSDYRTCPACYESVHKYASICPHCHTPLIPESKKTASAAETLLGAIVLGVMIYYFFEWITGRI